ncbi:MAG: cytidylate kinase-like family protein [Oscillospiraceae bacterium]|nr:cytidylate kinase-like family protein [Oscillospiraceae bacterium]
MNLTISGLLGTGGEEIAMYLEEKYNYRRVGKQLVTQASDMYAATSKKAAKRVFYDETMDAKPDNSVLNATLHLYLDVMPEAMVNRGQSYHLSREQSEMFVALRKVIRATFEENDKVIFMGRCAGHVLRRENGCINILTVDTPENCRARVAKAFDMDDDKEIKKLIRETNSRRINFYEIFTGLEWGKPENFDYCITPSILGIEKNAELIAGISGKG